MDITSLAQAWQADPSSFHGVAFWTDAGDFQGLAWPAAPSWGPQDAISMTASDTPEPATMALLAIGGVGALLRRRK